jgi:uncharacterized protein YjdB
MVIRTSSARWFVWFVALMTGFWLGGCGGGTPQGTISISGVGTALSAGMTAQLRATDTSNLKVVTDVTGSATWTSSNPLVATVSSTGLVTGVASGTATVTAVYGKDTGSVGVPVSVATVTGVKLSPATAQVFTGNKLTYVATATYTNGTTNTVTTAAAWSAAPSSVATIDASGVLTAVGPGGYVVTATVGGQSTTATGTVANGVLTGLAVTPALATVAGGASQQLTATATYSDGSNVNVSTSVTWSSGNTTLLTIDGNGVATAHGNGLTTAVTVTAALGTATANSTVTVTPGASLAALYVEPTSSSIATGSAERHTALAIYSDGTQKDVSQDVTWSAGGTAAGSVAGRVKAHANGVSALDATTVATIDPTGFTTAGAPGTTVVQASLNGTQSQSQMIVTAATVKTLDVRASAQLFPVGATQAVQLTGVFSDGSIQDLSLTAQWQSSDATVATIDSTGLATGIKSGRVTFRASFGGVTAVSNAFTILPPTLLSTVIDVPYALEAVGTNEQLRLLGNYTDGTTQDLTPLATWTSLNPTAFSVSSNGVAYAQVAGTAQITGTVFGITAITSVAALEVTQSQVQVLPANPKIALGTTRALTALATIGPSAVVDVSSPAIWTSGDPTIATVDGTGRVKGGKVGSTTMVARSLRQNSPPSTLTVTNATMKFMLVTPVNSQETPISAQIAALTRLQFSAIGFFSDGSYQDVTDDVQWSSSDPTIAAMDGSGVATGLQAGTVQISGTLMGQTVASSLTVTAARLQSVSILPDNAELPVNVTEQFSLVGHFSDGTTQDLTDDGIWGAPTSSIANEFLKGKVLGVTPGTGTITAQIGFFGASTHVNVTNATLTGISLTPASTTIRVGGRQQLTATGTFSDGYTQNLYLNAVFQSDNPAIADLGADALAYGTGVGTTRITATYGGITTATTSFQVLSGTLSSVAITPASPSVTAGKTQQFTATATFDDGGTMDVTGWTLWSTSNAAVLSVDATGLATAYAVSTPTTVTLTGVMGTVTTNVTVTVQPAGNGGAVPTSIVVNATSSHVATGTSVTLHAKGIYADNTTQDLTGAVTWASTDATKATVTSAGVATGVGPGLVNVTATLGAVQGAGVVNVSAATLRSVSMSPSGAKFAVGATQKFTLTGVFSDGSTQDLSASASWGSTASGVASISQTGLATGVGMGAAELSATYQGMTATTGGTVTPATLVSVTVTPANPSFAKGTEQRLKVTGTYSDGTTHDLTGVASFASSNAGVVSVSADGVATGVGTGSTQISVTVGGQTATQTATVTPATLVSMAVTPNSPSLANESAQQFTVIGTFSDGTTQDLTQQATWRSTNAQVMTIDANGLATGCGAGNVQISATLFGVTATTGNVSITPATLVSVAFSPANPSVAVGSSVQVTITGTFSDGTTEDLTDSALYSSSNTGVVSVSSDGLLTGAGIGTSAVTVTVNGVTSSFNATVVTSATVTSITVTPANTSQSLGGTRQFTATAHYSDATSQNVTSTATWSSSNGGAASINGAGLATTVGTGATTISAQAGGVTGSTGFTVTAATLQSIAITPSSAAVAKGGQQHFVAIGTYSDGTTQNLSTQVVWASSQSSVATIDSNGLATSTTGGSTQIIAVYQGLSSVVTLTVSPAQLSSLAVTPATASIAMGTAQQYKAVGTLTDGSTQDLTTSVTWSSSSASATVNAAGLAKSSSSGSTTITAQAGSTSATASLNMSTATATNIQLSPTTVSVPVGDFQQFLATATFSDGTSQDVTQSATYSTSNSSVATVDANGKLTARGPGTATVTATQGTATVSITVHVTTGTLTTVTITPANLSLAAGQSQQLTATGTFSDGSTQDLTNQVAWSSSSSSNVSVSTTGVATAVQVGAATITATENGISGTDSVTASSAVITAISVSPASVTLGAGQTQQFAATATMSDGTQPTVTSSVHWSVSDPSKATVSNSAGSNGFLTTSAAGTTNVVASSGSVTGSASVTIQGATLSSVAITPNPVSLPAGTTQTLMVTGTYSDGSTSNVTSSASFSSSNPSAAAVNATGVVRGVAAGTSTVTATVQGVSSTDTVTVTSATLSSIAITPAAPSVALGLHTQLTATGTYSD